MGPQDESWDDQLRRSAPPAHPVSGSQPSILQEEAIEELEANGQGAREEAAERRTLGLDERYKATAHTDKNVAKKREASLTKAKEDREKVEKANRHVEQEAEEKLEKQGEKVREHGLKVLKQRENVKKQAAEDRKT